MFCGRVASRRGRVTLTDASNEGIPSAGAILCGCCKLEKSCLGPCAVPKRVRTVRLIGSSSSSSSFLTWTGASSCVAASAVGAISAFSSCACVFRASSRSTRLLKTFWKASALACSFVSSSVGASEPPCEAKMSAVALSTSFSSACSELYAPLWTRSAMVLLD